MRPSAAFQAIGLMGSVWLSAVAVAEPAGAQQPEKAGKAKAAEAREYPSFPGQVTKPPAYLLRDAPFDVVKFFDAPPREENAAPLYLDALAEFHEDVLACFPAEEAEKTSELVRKRRQKIPRLLSIFSRDGKPADPAAIDALLSEYEVGFRKLAVAQKKPRCMFQTGLGILAVLPHVEGIRQAALLLGVKAERELARGDLDAAVTDLAMTLRLSRDVRPRGYDLCQAASIGIARRAFSDLLVPILNSPKLTPRHCDQLIQLLSIHEAQSVDAYTEGVRADYVMARATLHELATRPQRFRKQLGVSEDTSLAQALLWLSSLVIPAEERLELEPRLDANLKSLEAHGEAEMIRALNDLFKVLLDQSTASFSERAHVMQELEKKKYGDELILMKFLVKPELFPSYGNSMPFHAEKDLATIRASRFLVAIRRWMLNHEGKPTDPDAIAKEAGLAGVPLDPFSPAGEPLKMTLIGGDPVVYSVGRDGVDDKALKDAEMGRKPQGDLIYRLRTAKAH